MIEGKKMATWIGKTPFGTAGLCLALIALALTAGCAGTDPGKELATDSPGWKNIDLSGLFGSKTAITDQDLPYPWKKEMEYITALAEKPVASMADAIMLLTLFAGESPWGRGLDELTARLVEKEIFHGGWRVDKTDPLTFGRVSYMICQACEIRGGIWMRLFGPSERYCFKEALYLEIIPAGSTHRYVTGEQLLDILSAAHLHCEEMAG